VRPENLGCPLVPRTRSSHDHAASPIANFGVKRGTRIIDFASVLRFRSSHEGLPECIANFAIGTLASRPEAQRAIPARHHAPCRFRAIVPRPPSPSPQRSGLFFGHRFWQLVRYIGDARPRLLAPCCPRSCADSWTPSGSSGAVF